MGPRRCRGVSADQERLRSALRAPQTEVVPEHCALPVEKPCGNAGVRGNSIESVKRAWDNGEPAVNAGVAQTPCITAGLIAQQIQRANPDPRRSYTTQIATARGYRDMRIGTTKVGGPAQRIACVVPQSAQRGVGVWALRSPIVEHGIEQDLRRDVDLTAITSHQSECGGQPPACTRPRDRHAPRVHLRMRSQPDQRLIAVGQSGWIRMLRRESVVDCRDDDPQLVGHPSGEAVIHRRIPEDVASAVDPQQRSAAGLGGHGWPMHPDGAA